MGTQANRTTAIQANRFQDKANFKTKYGKTYVSNWFSRLFLPYSFTSILFLTEVGYIHKNLHDKYGFITKEKFQDNFKENVYFNLDSYRLGMQTNEYIPDMRNVVNWGEKVGTIFKAILPFMLDQVQLPLPSMLEQKYRYWKRQCFRFRNVYIYF